MTALADHETFLRLSRSRDFLAARYDRRLTLTDAAAEACLSKFHYQRLFQRTFGETPHEFLTRMRIERARELLASTDLPVSQVCLEIGYTSLGSFSTRFHQVAGCAPSEFRSKVRKVFALGQPRPARFVPSCFLGRYGILIP